MEAPIAGAVEFLPQLWKVLSREQKEGIILLSTSVPLGLASIVIGAFSGNLLLALVGLLTLGLGLYALIHCGFILIRVLFSLLGFLVKLPVTLVRSRKKRQAREGLSGEAKGTATPAMPPSSAQPVTAGTTKKPVPHGLAWFDIVFLVWTLLAVVQILMLLNTFFG